jgi:hypothetical protein
MIHHGEHEDHRELSLFFSVLSVFLVVKELVVRV